MTDKQKGIFICLIIYLVFITMFTFTEVESDFSNSIGLRVSGLYSHGKFIAMRGGYLNKPQYGAFIAYSLIGVIISVGLLKVTNKESD